MSERDLATLIRTVDDELSGKTAANLFYAGEMTKHGGDLRRSTT